MTTKSTDSASRLTAREYTAIHTKTPMSGTEWLDQMVVEARRLDAEQFKAKLQEIPDVSNPTTHTLQGKATKSKMTKKEPELRDQKD